MSIYLPINTKRMSQEKTKLVNDFTFRVMRHVDPESTEVKKWTAWCHRAKYDVKLPVVDGSVLDLAVVNTSAKWETDEVSVVTFLVDETYLTVEAKNEHALRLAINYLLEEYTKAKFNKDALVKMRREWHFNVYEETKSETSNDVDFPVCGLFDDDDF